MGHNRVDASSVDHTIARADQRYSRWPTSSRTSRSIHFGLADWHLASDSLARARLPSRCEGRRPSSASTCTTPTTTTRKPPRGPWSTCRTPCTRISCRCRALLRAAGRPGEGAEADQHAQAGRLAAAGRRHAVDGGSAAHVAQAELGRPDAAAGQPAGFWLKTDPWDDKVHPLNAKIYRLHEPARQDAVRGNADLLQAAALRSLEADSGDARRDSGRYSGSAGNNSSSRLRSAG